MCQVHAHRSALAQNRVRAISSIRPQQFGPDAQRLIRRMTHAEHPLIAAHSADAAAHLVGERLKTQTMVSCRQSARNGVAGTFGLLQRQKMIYRFFKSSLQKM